MDSRWYLHVSSGSEKDFPQPRCTHLEAMLLSLLVFQVFVTVI
jgi:hypothetical protein